MSEGNGKISRDDTRSALLNGYSRKTKLVTVSEGVTILLMEPTVAQRGRMLQAGGVSGSNTDISDISSMQIQAIIECACDPATKKPLFEPTDLDVLATLPATSWFDDVAGAAIEMMNKDAIEAGKPSKEDPIESLSSTSPTNSEEQSLNLKIASP